MSLENGAENAFEARTRLLGANLLETEGLEILEMGDWEFISLVRDRQGNVYQATINTEDTPSNRLGIFCTCPQFAESGQCEHLWAMLLEMDQLYEIPPMPPLKLHRTDPSVALLSFQAKGGNTWRDRLEQVTSDAFGRTRMREDPFRQITTKPRFPLYAINFEETSRGDGGLAVDVYHQEPKVNGDLSKPKKMLLNVQNVERLSEELDREVCTMLTVISQEDSSPYDYWRYSGPRDSSSCEIPSNSFSLLLPKLFGSGRAVYVRDETENPGAKKTVHWDDGAAYEFRLKITNDDENQQWLIDGCFVREDETLEVSKPLMVLAGGVLLLQDRVAKLITGDEFSWLVSLRRDGALKVPYEDRDELRKMLASMPALGKLETPDELGVERVSVTPVPQLTVLPEQPGSGSKLFLQVHFQYGAKVIEAAMPHQAIFDDESGKLMPRDAAKEKEYIAQLRQFTPKAADGFSNHNADLSVAKKQLRPLVDTLVNHGWVVLAEGVRMRRAGAFSMSVSSGVDWFELDGSVDFDGQNVALPTLLAAVRSGDKYVRLDDGSRGMLPEEWLAKYGSLADLGETDGDSLRFSTSQAALLDALLAAQENVSFDDKFLEFHEKLMSFDGIKAVKEPKSFQGELRNYQREGLGWLKFLQEYNFGGCLADDMGLGKTVQVLALLEERRLNPPKVNRKEAPLPSIAVVPRSLIFNWVEEAKRFTPDLRVLNYTGLNRDELFDEIADYDLIVTTYGTLRRDILRLKDMPFDYAILDESQAIKNANSQAAKACRLLNARQRLAMTGTPVENHLGELWSLFEFLNPGMLGRSSTFSSLSKTGSNQAGLPVLAQALRPYMLRRTKKEVLTELPEKTEQTLYCEMGEQQRREYDELREYYRVNLAAEVEKKGLQKSKIHVLEALLRLRQAACHPGLLDKKKLGQSSTKLDTLLEQVDEVISEGHKALVFSQFTSLLRIVRDRLDEKKVVYEYLDGRTRKRQERVERFQNDQDCSLFLISLKAGGHGLNLTAADYVFILDPWWNPAVEAQAIDRAHRIGQTQRVFAYRLICRDTVEDKIIELQKTKRDLADAIVSANNSVIRDLTAEDLQMLLS